MIQHTAANYQLTTAEILYRLPDFPQLLQSYFWQQIDLAPQFPALQKFLDFWQLNLDGKLHSVRVSTADLLKRAEFRHANFELTVH